MVGRLVAVRKFRVGRPGLLIRIGRPRLWRRWVGVLFEHFRQFITEDEGDDPEEDAPDYLERNKEDRKEEHQMNDSDFRHDRVRCSVYPENIPSLIQTRDFIKRFLTMMTWSCGLLGPCARE